MSIRLRFTLALTAVGILLFGTYALWSYRSEREDLFEAAKKELHIVGESLQTSLGNALRDKQHADIEATLRTLDAITPELDIHLHDPAGLAIAHSPGAAVDDVVEQLAARAATTKVEGMTLDPPDAPVRIIFTGPLTGDDGALIGSLAVVRPIDDIREDLTRTRDRLLLALGVFLVATMIAGLVLGTVHVSRPIARLLDGVQHVQEGDFKARVRPGRDDEIGQLVEQFNVMIERLAELRARIETEAEARARLELGLQRVDKLVTIGQLSAGLAHEIGSPLQVLSGRASVLLEHADPEVRRQAGSLVAQCDRITRVVEQLLSFGRRRHAHAGPCDLTVPVVAVLDLMSVEAKRRSIELSLVTDEQPHLIVGNVDQLQQLTLNLVRNALAATPSGGRIVVRVAGTRLSVVDTGPGIDHETQARLFEPFFTTRAAEGGTGLGLSVVKAIVEEHHATIDVISEPGSGAELVVTFPEDHA